jgi:hypothetical protein
MSKILTSFMNKVAQGEVPPGLQPGVPIAYTPVSPAELGVAGGLSVGVPWALSKLTKTPMSLASAAKYGLGAAGLPMALAFDVGKIGLHPLIDPEYAAGRRGLIGSMGAGATAAADRMAQASEEARRRYGIFGAPVQSLHGIFNPLSSAVYLAQALKHALTTKEGAWMAAEADAAVESVIGDAHALQE